MKRSPREHDLDRSMMHRAITLARRGAGRAEPNPMVGCVLLKSGRILGEGFHRRFGGPHAEIEALHASRPSPDGATAYVSLEPCCHVGKTPPCAEALIRAGVSRVVIGVPDPNPAVSGRSIAALRHAGLIVDVGLLAAQAAELIAPFATRVRLDRPYVIAKWAQSLDGRLAVTGAVRKAGHEPKWISGEASRRFAHRVRARVDAVLVGSGTVLADDPLLTARGVRVLRRATRVVLDGRLRIPVQCRLVATAAQHPTLVVTTQDRLRSPKARRLAARGVDLAACAARHGRINLHKCLNLLAQRDVTNLMVEGGPTVLSAFFSAGLVDEAMVFTAPILIGGDAARAARPGDRHTAPHGTIRPLSSRTQRLGDDILHSLRFTRPPVQIPTPPDVL